MQKKINTKLFSSVEPSSVVLVLTNNTQLHIWFCSIL